MKLSNKPIGEMTMDEVEAEILTISRTLDSLIPLARQAQQNPFFSVLVKEEREASAMRNCHQSPIDGCM